MLCSGALGTSHLGSVLWKELNLRFLRPMIRSPRPSLFHEYLLILLFKRPLEGCFQVYLSVSSDSNPVFLFYPLEAVTFATISIFEL